MNADFLTTDGAVYNLFPLTVSHFKLQIDKDERQKLVDEIQLMHRKSLLTELETETSFYNPNKAWTGDVHGQEFLFSNPKFDNISSLISQAIYKYLKNLSINTEYMNLYYQRTWATLTKEKQNIMFHTHAQSNISFVYFLVKPKNSGGTIFKETEAPNEFCKHLFSLNGKKKSFISESTPFNTNEVLFDVEQDSVLIFPSKSLHGTEPNESKHLRISLSGDIAIMLSESQGFEILMPDFKFWKELHKPQKI